jgi:hypothetical protein
MHVNREEFLMAVEKRVGRSIAIVGSEAAKFTPRTEHIARCHIRALIIGFDRVVSGGCHLGGIDIWAKEEALAAGKQFTEHLPKKLTWKGGFEQRNLRIARDCNECVCITVKDYPEGYSGMRFNFCYHCKSADHIKSGGCWTMLRAQEFGAVGRLIVVH